MNDRVFRVVSLVMIVVSVVGFYLGLNLTARMIMNPPENKYIVLSTDSIDECREGCLERCETVRMSFEHGKFVEPVCECFCVGYE